MIKMVVLLYILMIWVEILRIVMMKKVVQVWLLVRVLVLVGRHGERGSWAWRFVATWLEWRGCMLVVAAAGGGCCWREAKQKAFE